MAQGTSEQQKQQTLLGLLLFYFHSDLKKKRYLLKVFFVAVIRHRAYTMSPWKRHWGEGHRHTHTQTHTASEMPIQNPLFFFYPPLRSETTAIRRCNGLATDGVKADREVRRERTTPRSKWWRLAVGWNGLDRPLYGWGDRAARAAAASDNGNWLLRKINKVSLIRRASCSEKKTKTKNNLSSKIWLARSRVLVPTDWQWIWSSV